MTETTTPGGRERLERDVETVLRTLPSMGRVMIAANRLGATHERIGVVETVTTQDGWVVQRGAEHDSAVEADAVRQIIVDRTGRMGDKAYPRIDFMAEGGVALFSVVGFDGLEPFDAALAPLGAGAPVEAKPDEPRGERGEVGEDDPGGQPLHEALARGDEVAIGFRRPGFRQVWRGRLEAVKPAMGFINVIRPDFHLHLKAGSVARWAEAGSELRAVGHDGVEIGLVLAQAPFAESFR